MKYTKKTTFVISLLILSTLHATINAASIVNDVIRRQAGTLDSGNTPTQAGATTVENSISAPNTPVQTRQVLTLIAESALPYQGNPTDSGTPAQTRQVSTTIVENMSVLITQMIITFVTSPNALETSTANPIDSGAPTPRQALPYQGNPTDLARPIQIELTESETTRRTSTSTSTSSTESITTSTVIISPPPPPSQTTTTENVCSDTDCQMDTSTGMTGQIITTTIMPSQTDGDTAPMTTITPTITDSKIHPTTTKYVTTTYQSTITVIFPGYTTTIYTTSDGIATSSKKYVPPSTVLKIVYVTAIAANIEAQNVASGGSDKLNCRKEMFVGVIVSLLIIGISFSCSIVV
ncbi:8223_t:CDS:10 [Acaulospora morrowiae]|uniref:8223_t:CDS:1 n=1 Tax=Acaulospora morrowiae TaxID=94023 RepID=A0A9N8WFZ4_9GLOM|nr:8223_t:CDS:10 [Acaulospora morrowiae]